MSKEDIEQTANLLAKLKPGWLPYPIFEQIARIVVLPILELIPLKRCENEVEVLLLQRSNDDPLWPGMWHTPGTVIRATDLSASNTKLDSALVRLARDELHDTELGEAHFVANLFHRSKRGVEQAQVYWAEVLEEPKVGKFFSIASLPDSLIESQRTFIEEAARSFDRQGSRQQPELAAL